MEREGRCQGGRHRSGNHRRTSRRMLDCRSRQNGNPDLTSLNQIKPDYTLKTRLKCIQLDFTYSGRILRDKISQNYNNFSLIKNFNRSKMVKRTMSKFLKIQFMNLLQLQLILCLFKSCLLVNCLFKTAAFYF